MPDKMILVYVKRPEYTQPPSHYEGPGQLIGLNGETVLVPFEVWCEIPERFEQVLEYCLQPERIKFKRKN